MVDDLSAFYTVDDEGQVANEAETGGGKAKGKKSKGDAVGNDDDPRFRLKAGMGGPAAEEDEDDEDRDDSGVGSDGGSEAGEDEDGAKEKPAASRGEMEERLEYLNRLARGEAGSDASVSTSSSSSNGSDDEDDDEDSEGEGVVESRRLEAGPVPMGGPTRRLAIMNVDWDHLKAVDLLGVLISFKPAAGRVMRVTVYCSDYGLQKMAEEARLGPGFLRGGTSAATAAAEGQAEAEGDDDASDGSSSVAAGVASGPEDEDEGEGEEVDQEALRAYEIQRLRYHFAVAECDSVGTAAALYEEVDGLEFEASAAQLDARFVPDDVAFEGRPVRDEAEALPSDYGARVWV